LSDKPSPRSVASLTSVENKTISSFAPIGTTSPFTGDLYAIHIFDPDTSRELWAECAAHYGVIYDLRSASRSTFIEIRLISVL
jgi:hypothetical protein